MSIKVDTFGIPLKKSSDVDLLKPLKNILTRFTTTEQEGYVASINELNKLRQNAVTRTLDYHESSLDILYRYYDQLASLENKIPVNEIQIPFKWKDAFDKGSIFGGRISLTISSVSYEKVCVLFNIAALQSQVAAAAQTAGSDESLKTSAKLFQSASGILNHLKTAVHGCLQQDPTPDLQPDTLTALTTLLLAQAQEVITLKAIADRMKDGVVAKLCAQCEEMYAEALKNLQRETLKPLWDRDWVSKVAGKQAGYHALSEYHQSKVCNANKVVGEEIARLKHALELFKAAQTRSADLTLFAEEMGRAQRAHDDAVKDNDFIYHERVPDIKLLPAIGKAAVAKPTPLPEKFSANFTDMFESLVPVAVQQALVQYDVRKQEIVNTEISKLRESTQLLNSILASLNLPAAIEDTSGEQLPPSVRDKSNNVCEKGGVEALQKMLTELPDLLTRNKELLDECERQLKEEKDSDDQLREQFKNKWQRTPSDKLTQTFQTNSSKYRRVIETAIRADGTIREKFENNLVGMQMLSKGPIALATDLPSVGSTNNSSSPAVTRLRQLMESVETLKAERDAIESELKCATADMRDVFLNALSHDGAINEPIMSVESLGRLYGDLQKQVKESLGRQESLVSDIQTAHTEFSQANTGTGGERETVLKKLAAGHDTYIELSENLNEGTKFYNDLTQLLVTFQGKISDFCFARRTEKEELMKDLTQGLASQQFSAAPTPPTHHQEEATKVVPPRPPPPQAPQVNPTSPPFNPYAGAPPQAPQAPHAPHAPPAAAPHAPYPGAPAAPQAPYAGAPVAPQVPYPGAPPAGNLPYPMNPQGMPTPQGYVYNSYPVYTPMPGGYNPYFQQQPGSFGSYAASPYPQQQPQHPSYPYPQQPQQQPPQWPPQP